MPEAVLDLPPDDDLSPAALPSWRERLDELRSRWTLTQWAAASLLVAGAVVATFAVLRPVSPAPPTELSLPIATAPAPATSTVPPEVVVHVAGAVMSPGLYRLAVAGRVADLLKLAGGPATDADLDRVNLAAVVHDGERVVVPRVGEPLPQPWPAATSSTAGPINLNTASADELDSLPGIGPAIAKAIVDDLGRVRGIGRSKVDDLRGLVTV